MGVSPLFHLPGKQDFHRLPHHRIQPVKGLVTEEILDARADTAEHRQLLLHSLGKGVDPAPCVQAEFHQHLLEPLPIEGWVVGFVQPDHVPGSAVFEKNISSEI